MLSYSVFILLILTPSHTNKVRLRIHHTRRLISKLVKWYANEEVDGEVTEMNCLPKCCRTRGEICICEHKVSDPPAIVDPSELDNYINDDDVQYTGFIGPNVEVNDPNIEVNEPNVDLNDEEVEVNEPNIEVNNE
ncbi:unnamed protein product [Vicia faba]|uniref:Uncharacterized protein n=1 Tax=Vicia faba TaxID=3906 RepID=A0AAV0Z405_VICFA|nr:unnamed protein product [Vicia faba]